MSSGAAEPPIGVFDAVLDAADQRVTVAPCDATVRVEGWAVDAGARAFAALECAIGTAAAYATPEPRPDVAALFGSPSEVGFNARIALGAAPPGRHRMVLTGVRADGTRVPIAVNGVFDVVAAAHALPGLPLGPVIGALDAVHAEAERDRTAGEPGVAVVPPEGVVVLTGWAATPDGDPLDHAYAEIDGSRIVRGMAGYARPDVGAHLGRAGELDYGFRIRFPAELAGEGSHSVRVFAEAGGVLAAIGEPARVVVAPKAEKAPARSGHREGAVDLFGRAGPAGGESDADRILDQRSRLGLRRDERLVVTGWAGDAERRAIPDLVLLTVDGALHGAVRRGLRRPDVAAESGCAELEASGFSVVVEAARLGTGDHRAELLAVYGEEVVSFDAFSFAVTG